MTERGKDHLGALCVVAAALAERFWTVMNRGMPYVICDTDNNPSPRPKRRSSSRSSGREPRGPRPTTEQEDGEGPPESPYRTNTTGRPSPPTILNAAHARRQQANRLTADPLRNQNGTYERRTSRGDARSWLAVHG